MKIRIAVICTLFSVSAATVTTSVIAEPLVTISCDQPMGSSIAYGAPSSDRTNARSEPTKSNFGGPHKRWIYGEADIRHRFKSEENYDYLERTGGGYKAKRTSEEI
jgi:hypothetical protein